MNTINLAEMGARVDKRKAKVMDLSRNEYRKLIDAVIKAINASTNFTGQGEASADGYRKGFDDLYVILARHAGIAFAKEFVPELMSRAQIDQMMLPDGLLTLSFDYYSARETKRRKITFRSELAPITDVWPELVIKHGAPSVIKEKYKAV